MTVAILIVLTTTHTKETTMISKEQIEALAAQIADPNFEPADLGPPASNFHTRRRLGGRHPLCGIAVTSRIDVTVKPTVVRGLTILIVLLFSRRSDSEPSSSSRRLAIS